ncbi:MAG: hypothetical protein ABI388_07605 [Bacteroidia bacterium]
MKKLSFVLGLFLLAIVADAQVKQNENGLYTNVDGSLFTGRIENKDKSSIQSEIEIKNGLPSGEVTYYYASGKVMETGTFENGQKDGKWLRYNEMGINVGLAIYNLGKKNGAWIVWDDGGKKRFEMHYNMNEKAGTWYNWDEKGELISSKDYTQAN